MEPSRTVSRREFLRVSTLALAGVCLAGCSPSNPAASDPATYYVANQAKIEKDVKKLAGYIQKACEKRYDAAQAETLVQETLTGFEKLLPDLPYIGGDGNELTQNLYQGAAALAFYRAMLAHGKTLPETGEILYRAVSAQAAAQPLVGMAGRISNSGVVQKLWKDDATESQKRKYPADWVYSFVEGDGKTFDFGIDYTECGICKYYAAQNATELTPYLCILDFPMSQAMDTGLVRTSTIGEGGERCDFRYKTGRPCQMEWTPEFLKNGA